MPALDDDMPALEDDMPAMLPREPPSLFAEGLELPMPALPSIESEPCPQPLSSSAAVREQTPETDALCMIVAYPQRFKPEFLVMASGHVTSLYVTAGLSGAPNQPVNHSQPVRRSGLSANTLSHFALAHAFDFS